MSFSTPFYTHALILRTSYFIVQTVRDTQSSSISIILSVIVVQILTKPRPPSIFGSQTSSYAYAKLKHRGGFRVQLNFRVTTLLLDPPPLI